MGRFYITEDDIRKIAKLFTVSEDYKGESNAYFQYREDQPISFIDKESSRIIIDMVTWAFYTKRYKEVEELRKTVFTLKTIPRGIHFSFIDTSYYYNLFLDEDKWFNYFKVYEGFWKVTFFGITFEKVRLPF